MRSRLGQVDRIDAAIATRVPCYRDPSGEDARRAAGDGKRYPIGERWEWRRMALRREAVGAILEVDPKASVRVVRDVLARYGHQVSHELVRLDMRAVRNVRPPLVESGRWLSVEAWREETARRRVRRRASGPGWAPVRSDGIAVRAPVLRGGVAIGGPPEPTAEAPSTPPSPTPDRHAVPPPRPLARRPVRRDDWAVWDRPATRR